MGEALVLLSPDRPGKEARPDERGPRALFGVPGSVRAGGGVRGYIRGHGGGPGVPLAARSR